MQDFASCSQPAFAHPRAQANGLTVVDTLDSVLLQRAYLPTQQTMQAQHIRTTPRSQRQGFEMHDRLLPFMLAAQSRVVGCKAVAKQVTIRRALAAGEAEPW
jgi:hypothetical protein